MSLFHPDEEKKSFALPMWCKKESVTTEGISCGESSCKGHAAPDGFCGTRVSPDGSIAPFLRRSPSPLVLPLEVSAELDRLSPAVFTSPSPPASLVYHHTPGCDGSDTDDEAYEAFISAVTQLDERIVVLEQAVRCMLENDKTVVERLGLLQTCVELMEERQNLRWDEVTSRLRKEFAYLSNDVKDFHRVLGRVTHASSCGRGRGRSARRQS